MNRISRKLTVLRPNYTQASLLIAAVLFTFRTVTSSQSKDIRARWKVGYESANSGNKEYRKLQTRNLSYSI